MPAASAVVSDIVDIAETIVAGADPKLLHAPVLNNTEYSIKPIDECESRYYIRFQALDIPGVLASVAGILGDRNISISSVIQQERREGESVPLVMMTHEAIESDVQDALRKIDDLPSITAKSVLIRVETMDGEEEKLSIV